MKLNLDKKKLLKVGGIGLLFVAAAVGGLLAQQLFNKQPTADEGPKTVSGLPQEVDDVQSLRLNGESEEANKKTDELLNQAGTTDEVKYMLYEQKGHSSMEAKDYKAALGFFTQASEFSENYIVFTLIGEANISLGDKPAAKTAFQKALSLISPEQEQMLAGEKRDLEQRIEILEGKPIQE